MHAARWLKLALAPLLACWCSPATPAEQPSDHARAAQFHCWTNFASFASEPSFLQTGQIAVTSPYYHARWPANELIASWCVSSNAGPCQFAARIRTSTATSSWFQLGTWSFNDHQSRHSVASEPSPLGHVDTDLLVLAKPATDFQLRIVLAPADLPYLHALALSLRNSELTPSPLPPYRAAWGVILDVPMLSQLSYAGGKGWCSPTSTTMTLKYWARHLQSPALNWEVPAVAEHVFDRVYGGTGNWPFNTAFASALPQLQACVARFTDVSEIEQWIAKNVPVIASVSLHLLRGQPRHGDDGHLVVCAGFSPAGDVIVNDPGSQIEPRKIVPRTQFRSAWSVSGNTVYLIYPIGHPTPENRFAHWN